MYRKGDYMRFFVIKIPKWLGAIINFFRGLFKPKSKKNSEK